MIQFENAVSHFSKLILKELSDAGIQCWIAGGALRDYFAGVKVTTVMSKEDEDEYYDLEEEDFQRCPDCGGHDACRDFGCAFKLGLGHMVKQV